MLRVDASPEIGAGHLMRCLALAQAWRRAGGDATFLLAEVAPSLLARLKSEGMVVRRLERKRGSTEDARETAKLAREAGASWLVADGYGFGAKYQRVVKSHGVRLVVLDDYGHAERYFADIILNQNLDARREWYAKRPARARLLLGTKYALLRDEFRGWSGYARKTPAVAEELLVTLGHADTHNFTLEVIQALDHVETGGMGVTVVMGGSNPHRKELEAAAQGARADIQLAVGTTDMPDLMASADVAVAAGGTTSWEVAFMGLPTFTVILAENQQGIAEAMDRAGAAINLGWHADLAPDHLAAELSALLNDPQTRQSMSDAGQRLVDGRGAERVVNTLRADLARG